MFTELSRDNEEEKVTLSLNKTVTPASSTKDMKSVFKNPLTLSKSTASFKPKIDMKRKQSALDDIMKQEEFRKEKSNRKDNWVTEVSSCKFTIKMQLLKFFFQK